MLQETSLLANSKFVELGMTEAIRHLHTIVVCILLSIGTCHRGDYLPAVGVGRIDVSHYRMLVIYYLQIM